MTLPLRTRDLTGWLLATGLCAAANSWASPIESVVDTAGSVGFVALNYGNHTVNSGIAIPAEIDGYSFDGVAGQNIRVALGSETFGLDPVITLRGPNSGTVLTQASCAGNDFFGAYKCSAYLDYNLPGTGSYTLNVADSGLNEAGLYDLHIDQYPSPVNWVGLGYAAPATHELGHRTDSDYFAFNGVAGSGIQFNGTSNTLGIDLGVEIWDPSGQRIVSKNCAGNDFFGSYKCVNATDLDLTLTGVYRVSITDAGWDETGSYTLYIGCLYGQCATGVPLPVPEPGTWLLMLGGLGVVISWRARRLGSGTEAS